MVSPANALKWSLWLAANHPAAFAAVARRVIPSTQLRRNTPGLGNVQAKARDKMKPFARGRFGAFGQDGSDSVDLPEVTVEAPAVDVSAVPDSTLSDPILQDINVSVPGDVSFDLGQAASASDNAGGFWSSVGSGLSSVGSGLASAVDLVAGAVTNPQVLASAGNLAANVIKSQAQTQSASQALAILQAQQARTLSGVGAAPVTYRVNPATGQSVPYYYNAQTGQYTPVSAGVGAISLPGNLNTYLPWILAGGIVLVLFMARPLRGGH